MDLPVRINDCVSVFLAMQQIIGVEYTIHSASSPTESPLFISIDLEYTHKAITQLGISVFDSRSLKFPSLAEDPIKSTWYSTHVCRYLDRKRKRYLFGERQLLRPNDIHKLLTQTLSPTNYQGLPVSRNVILVGHGISGDISVIKRLHNLDMSRIPTVKAILDTVQIAHRILDPPRPLCLKELLDTLQLEHIGLHNAGNDARYTLQALLLMLCKCRRSSFGSLRADETEQFARLESIATFFKPRERISWCENSPRVKFDGNTDLLDQEKTDDDDFDSSVLGSLLNEEEASLNRFQ